MNAAEMKSLEEVRRAFSTQRKCEAYLKRLRWPNGVTCPRCGAKHPLWMPKYRRWHCRNCRYQFSVTSGTIFHRSKVPLPKWFIAIWLMCHSPKGISAKQLERELGVHYETAWYMAKRIRQAMRHNIFEDKLCGIVEVDDARVKTDNPGGGSSYTKVLGMPERGGALKMVVLERLIRENIEHIVARNLGRVKKIYSDAAYRFRFLGEIAEHSCVAHYITYSDSEVHVVNFVENA